MKRFIAYAILIAFCGCSQSSTSKYETWTGDRDDGFPNWTIASEIPTALHRPAPSAVRGHKDGEPLCYVRGTALSVPPDCFAATNGDADYYVKRYRAAAAINPKMKTCDTFQCGHGDHAVQYLNSICFRLYEDGGASALSEVIDEAEYGKALVYSAKPLAIGESESTIVFAMQGVDDWTPAGQEVAWWHSSGETNLSVSQSYTEWATMRTGENHVLTMVSLEKITTGEIWDRQAREREKAKRVAMH